MTRSTHFFSAIMLILSTTVLSGCSDLIASFREGPIQEDYSKRTFGSTVDDQLIETKMDVNLKKSSYTIEKSNINPHAYNGVLLLTGQVPSLEDKEELTKIAERIRKVRRVHNEVSIGDSKPFLAKANDTWLSSKVRTRLRLNENIDVTKVKVISENGVIYLMGLVTESEAERIVKEVSKTGGIQQIVKAFEYITVDVTE